MLRYGMPALQCIGRTGEALASIDELIALIEEDIGKSYSANASIEVSRAGAEELAGLFLAMNVDGQASRSEQVQQALADALGRGRPSGRIWRKPTPWPRNTR